MSDVSFVCPKCGNGMSAPRFYRGKVVKCISCQEDLEVPVNAVPARDCPAKIVGGDVSQADVSGGAGVFLFLVGVVFFWWVFVADGCSGSDGESGGSGSYDDRESEMNVGARVWIAENFLDAEFYSGGFNVDQGTGTVVVKGKNAFGGPVVNRYYLKFDSSGGVVSSERAE